MSGFKCISSCWSMIGIQRHAVAEIDLYIYRTRTSVNHGHDVHAWTCSKLSFTSSVSQEIIQSVQCMTPPVLRPCIYCVYILHVYMYKYCIFLGFFFSSCILDIVIWITCHMFTCLRRHVLLCMFYSKSNEVRAHVCVCEWKVGGITY